MPTLRDLGEVETLRRLAAARRAPPGTVVDAGDDAAVVRVRPGHDLVATTDTQVEGRHFLPEWLAPGGVGARLAIANLSDLAAMRAMPRWALLSLGVRADHDADALMDLERGLATALEAEGAGIVGGNLTAVAGAEWYGLTLFGEVERGAEWTRHGARPGDLIAVSGAPGRAGAGARLAAALGEGARDPGWTTLLAAWLTPVARVGLARALGDAGGVTAAIDISDGLAGDLARLAEASGVGAALDEAAWPMDSEIERAAAALGADARALRLGPSDDYELIVALDPAARQACALAAQRLGVPFTFIGRLTDTPGVVTLRDAGGQQRTIEAVGYDHLEGPA
jgi:thiamine-monophosphate kinase